MGYARIRSNNSWSLSCDACEAAGDGDDLGNLFLDGYPRSAAERELRAHNATEEHKAAVKAYREAVGSEGEQG